MLLSVIGSLWQTFVNLRHDQIDYMVLLFWSWTFSDVLTLTVEEINIVLKIDVSKCLILFH